nr:sensor domain-containing diguanylate cyclase [Sporolactobacillus kofuensis]
MSKVKQRVVGAIWFFSFIVTMPLLYITDPPRNITPSSLITVGLVFVLTALFSFKVKGTDIIALQGIGLAGFLIFGLFVETLLTQFGILVYLLSQRIGKNDVYRLPLNSVMFLLVSLSAGSAYYALGGEIGVVSGNVLDLSLIPIIGFYLSAYLVNTLCLDLIRRWLLSLPVKAKVFDKDAVWEIVVTAMMMPLGIAFYLMYGTKGWLGMMIIAVPMVTLSVIVRLINNSQELIKFLQSVNHLGQQLTEELSVKRVLDLLFEKMPDILPVDYLYVVMYTKPEKPKLIRMFRKDEGESFVPFQQEADISLRVYRQAKAVIGSGNAGEMYPFLDALSDGRARSYLSVPMMHRGQVLGVMTLASHINKAYTKTSRIGMEIVGDFLAIALENAKNFEIRKKESERCPLTDLFNYRYLMKAISKLFNNPALESFSIIMLDIDNFKRINDTYGHQNGNAILIGVANRLRKTVGHKGIVARYGGEEFTVLLPGLDRNLCFAVAETIRLAVAAEPFMIFNESDNRYDQIYVTISLGTSTAPADATESSELIYNADHAMYKGAKQKGKNRVARYV